MISSADTVSMSPKRSQLPARIVFVNRFFYPDESATSQILTDLTRWLVKESFDVHVVCSRQRYDDSDAALAAAEEIDGIHVHRVATTTFGRQRLVGRVVDYASFYLTSSLQLWRLIRRDDVIVAKTDPPMLSLTAAVIAKFRGATLINWLQDVFPEVASHLQANPLPAAVTGLLCRLRDASLHAAACNVVLGERMQTHFVRRGIAAERLRIIQNWADGERITPQSHAGSCLRAALGDSDSFIVMYSGNLGRAHEYATLLGAAKQLRSERGIRFVMIGDGAKMREFRLEAQRHALANVVFLPYQSREALSDSLGAANVHLACLIPELEGLIVPSKFYGILAAGRPVIFIGDQAGELSGVIRSADCGAVVSTGDSDALVSTLLNLRSDPELTTRLGCNARAVFEADYTLRCAAEKWLTVIRQCGVASDRVGVTHKSENPI